MAPREISQSLDEYESGHVLRGTDANVVDVLKILSIHLHLQQRQTKRKKEQSPQMIPIQNIQHDRLDEE